MADFEKLEFKVSAIDEASKTLDLILKKINELQKSIKSLSNIETLKINLNINDNVFNDINKATKNIKNATKEIENLAKAQKSIKNNGDNPFLNYYPFNAKSEYFTRDVAVDMENLTKAQKGYFNSLRSLENSEIAYTKALENRNKIEKQLNNTTSGKLRDKLKPRLEKAELALLVAENNLLKARNNQIAKRQKVDVEGKYPTWEVYSRNLGLGDLTPFKKVSKQIEGGGTQEIEYYQSVVGNIKTTYKVIDGQVRDISSNTIKLQNDIKKTKKETNGLSKATQKVGKFMKSIGRIVLYRTIRTTMAEIKKAVVSSTQALAEADKSFNNIMSRLVTATDKLKYSLGLILQPFIEILTPIVEGIANIFVDIANYMSYTNAKAEGLSDYLKITSKYSKDYLDNIKEASNLLSFDKFEVLKKGAENPYEKEKVDINKEPPKTNENIKKIVDIIENLKTILNDVIRAISEIAGNILKSKVFKQLLTVIAAILKVISKAIVPAIAIISNVVTFVYNIFIGIYNLLMRIAAFFTVDYMKLTGPQRKLEQEKIYSSYKQDYIEYIDFRDYVEKADELENSVKEARSRTRNSFNERERVDRENVRNRDINISIDFSNTDNNAISRELAQSMATQFRKQNINVNFNKK